MRTIELGVAITDAAINEKSTTIFCAPVARDRRCPDCGRDGRCRAAPQDLGTLAAPRSSTTRRCARYVLRRLLIDRTTISAIAVELGVSWNTVMTPGVFPNPAALAWVCDSSPTPTFALCFASVLQVRRTQARGARQWARTRDPARDYYNPAQHLEPYSVANPELLGSADMLIAEDVCSKILAPAVHEDMADRYVARVLTTARERGSQ